MQVITLTKYQTQSMVAFSSFQTLLLLLGKLFDEGKCPLTSPQDYPQCHTWDLKDYDFIIVGGGTSGCVLANRLSENPNWNVLLVEAGDYPSNLSQIPELFMKLIDTKEDWKMKPEVGKTYGLGYENQQFRIPQGKLLGGSSGINGMMFTEGIPLDYDHWEEMGNKNWGYKTMKKYFRKLDARLSESGYVKTNKYETDLPGRTLIIKAAKEINFPVNQGKPVEYRDVRTTIANNERSSMAKAYLSPIKNRPNLCVLVNTLATKILIENKRAIGVEILTEVGLVNVYARKEVIISAGPLNSPKLLLLSGIGPSNQLRMHGIKTIKDLPVGRFHKDHAGVPMYFTLPPPNATKPISVKQDVKDYCTRRTGALTQVNMGNFQGYINTKGLNTYPNVEFMQSYLPVNGIMGPEAFLNFNKETLSSLQKHNERNPLLFILTTLLKPKSQGFLTLKSKDPLDSPRFFPNYLSDPEDRETIMETIQFLHKLFDTETLRGQGFVDFDIPNCRGYEFQSEEYWHCYMTNFGASFYHHTGTCRMGPRDDGTSVIDPQLKVWGIEGLRVCDTSAFPTLISAHTMIPAVAFAEHGSDIIKTYYNYNNS